MRAMGRFRHAIAILIATLVGVVAGVVMGIALKPAHLGKQASSSCVPLPKLYALH